MTDPILPPSARVVAECFKAIENPEVTQPACPESMRRAMALEMSFTSGVLLMRAFPVEQIRTLANNVWDVVHHKHVLTAVGPDVPTLTFIAMRGTGVHSAAFVLPHRWCEMIQEDEVMQAGALICNGSKAVDYYNGRMEDREVNDRAFLYESAFLHNIRGTRPMHEFNDYQKHVMKEFPKGLSDPRASSILYAYRPVQPMAQA